MTCIVGLVNNGTVYIGGDSAAIAGDRIRETGLRKVFRTGPFLVGYSTSFRMGQLLQFNLSVPKRAKGTPDLEYLATKFVDSVRDCFSDGGFIKKSEDGDDEGGQFLVGFNGRLYIVDYDFHVNFYADDDNFHAIGSGQEYALGSLASTSGLPPKKRIKLALKVAGRFSSGVCPPYYIEKIK